MKLLLDTHAFLWFVWGHESLSEKARTVMSDPANDLFLSVASCWEMAIKVSLGKLSLAAPVQGVHGAVIDQEPDRTAADLSGPRGWRC